MTFAVLILPVAISSQPCPHSLSKSAYADNSGGTVGKEQYPALQLLNDPLKFNEVSWASTVLPFANSTRE